MFHFDDIEVNSEPFPHAITKNVITWKEFNSLIEEFPNYEEVSQYEKVMGGRRRLSSDTYLFYDFLNNHPSWKLFYNYVNSKEFVNELLNTYKDQLSISGCNIDDYEFDENLSYRKALKTSDHIKSRIRNKGWYSVLLKVLFKLKISLFLKTILTLPSKFYQLSRPTKLHIHMDISSSTDGYNVETHHDSESRVAVFLIFFSSSEEVGGTGGEFCIYKTKKSESSSYPMFPSEDDVELYLKVPPTKNLMFSFLSTPNSYHSVPEMKGCKEPRKFIYVAVTANKTNIWRW